MGWTFYLPILAALSACGGDVRREGTARWALGELRFVIESPGAFALELNARGPVPVDVLDQDGRHILTLGRGGSARIRRTGSHALLLVNRDLREAAVAWVLKGPSGTTVRLVE